MLDRRRRRVLGEGGERRKRDGAADADCCDGPEHWLFPPKQILRPELQVGLR